MEVGFCGQLFLVDFLHQFGCLEIISSPESIHVKLQDGTKLNPVNMIGSVCIIQYLTVFLFYFAKLVDQSP